jgi:hypothetical protein
MEHARRFRNRDSRNNRKVSRQLYLNSAKCYVAPCEAIDSPSYYSLVVKLALC